MLFKTKTFLRPILISRPGMSALVALGLCGMLFAQPASTATASKASRETSDPGARTEPGASTPSVEVKLVNVLATVRDKHGKILSDLNQSDFMLQEDSHPVPIQYFSKETNLQLTLGLLVDTSLSQRSLLDQEKAASNTFLEQVLRDPFRQRG